MTRDVCTFFSCLQLTAVAVEIVVVALRACLMVWQYCGQGAEWASRDKRNTAAAVLPHVAVVGCGIVGAEGWRRLNAVPPLVNPIDIFSEGAGDLWAKMILLLQKCHPFNSPRDIQRRKRNFNCVRARSHDICYWFLVFSVCCPEYLYNLLTRSAWALQ